mgnify:CR=1 FL=1
MNKSRQKTQQKYLLALKDLYLKTSSGQDFSTSEFMKYHKLNNNVITILIKEKILIKTNFGYKWNSIEPNREMTLKLLDKINTYRLHGAKSNNIKKQDEIKIVKNEEIDKYNKYSKVLNDIYFLLNYSHNVSLQDYCENNKINQNIPTQLKNIEAIEFKDKKWFWIGDKPNDKMVKDLINVQKEINRKRYIKKDNTNNKSQVKNREIKFIIIEFLWGLFKIKAYPVYK